MLLKGMYMEAENDRAEEYALRPGRKYIEGASPAFPCPVCRSKAHARTTEALSLLVKKLYYRCFNPECGHRWTAHLEYIATTTPSLLGPVKGAIPRLNLPLRTADQPPGSIPPA